MAIQKLFIEKVNTDWKRLGNSMSTEYMYNGKELGIKWKDKIKKYPAKIGDAFAVNCDGAFPKVTPLTPPKNTGEKLLWLVGFNKHKRAKSENEVLEIVRDAERYGWWGYRDFHFCKKGKWHLVLSNRRESSGYYPVIGWVSDDLTKEEIEEFINQYIDWMPFPKWYIRNFIKEHFNI